MKNILITIIISFLAVTVMAQEKQVPFFPESKTYTITKKMAKKSGLFSEYKQFEEAKLFILPDSSFVLEVLYKDSGSILKDRKVMSKSEKVALIQQLKEKGKAKNAALEIDHSGRSALLLGNTLMGLSYYAPTMIGVLDIDDYKLGIATYMLTAGLSYIIPYTTTKKTPVTRAQASMMFHGQTRGILHGMATAFIIDSDYYNDNFEHYNDNGLSYYGSNYEGQMNDRRIRNTFGTLFSIGEGIAGFHLAKKWDFDRGEASMFQLGGDVGLTYGLLASDVLGFYKDPTEHTVQTTFGISLLSSAAGYYFGKKFADKHEYTLGDAIALRTTIFTGALVSITLVDYFSHEYESTKPYTVGTILGSAIGGYLGMRHLRNKDLSTGQGILIGLGTTAGCLIGLGFGALIMPENADGPDILLTGASLGAIGGYLLSSNAIIKKLAFNQNKNFDINFAFNPAALLLNNSINLRPDYVPTVASLMFTF